ncbi:uncharacterized protein A1O9_03302 [Exophiala aquamarina CBS 119918]|uniref:Pre-rRNA-processing protein n=1 Tax=Exophiala aquamarina CBS 119918 TaxID=1182545 RepID=A0A072PPR9_9EURO|nr:uncharacterized protein A1O9_03302 [Exophiala aquamarina CBS 119918]KEF61732.1 hypothetical protein A1O9_03302 [Exophiala aquamarina CBS 119918]
MGSSAKKKREKKKDFQKPKLKVGKARPKAANTTDTSFRSKAIVLNQQLDIHAPSESAKFLHQVSLLTSRSDPQRRDALAYLTTYVTSTPEGASLPTTASSLLTAVCPLILDGSNGVRNQLLKLFRVLPEEDVKDHVVKILPYMRAGMTHLSKDIRLSAVEFLSYLIGIAGDELVSSPGGWYQTLECFTTVLGWRSTDSSKWSANKASFGGDIKSTTRIMVVLAEFLRTGLVSDKDISSNSNVLAIDFPLWQVRAIAIPTKSSAYAYLNLFGPQTEADNQMLEDREDRMEVFSKHFEAVITAGIDAAKKEGGELGRASGLLVKALSLSHIG